MRHPKRRHSGPSATDHGIYGSLRAWWRQPTEIPPCGPGEHCVPTVQEACPTARLLYGILWETEHCYNDYAEEAFRYDIRSIVKSDPDAACAAALRNYWRHIGARP